MLAPPLVVGRRRAPLLARVQTALEPSHVRRQLGDEAQGAINRKTWATIECPYLGH